MNLLSCAEKNCLKLFELCDMVLNVNVAAEIDTHQTRHCFSNLSLYNFCGPVRKIVYGTCS